MLAQERRRDFVLRGLRELGYYEGKNLSIDVRSIEDTSRIGALADELVGLKPDVVLAGGTQAVKAVQRATKTIPIVMTASDPVGSGLVASLARPAGNTTGVSLFSPDLSGKRMELLRTVTGDISTLAVLWNPDDPPAVVALKETEDAARALQVKLSALEVRRVQDYAPAFGEIGKAQPKGLIILNSAFITSSVVRIAELAIGLKLPSIYTDRSYPEAGGLMSYGPSFDAAYKRLAVYIDRIFKGARPADLPVEQPTTFDFIVNLKTAKVLGITLPPNVLTRADDVIE
ncbi:MAG: ABC transporter substrate-binding protein [Reyranella sp.]|nr:ABC transporter substrate-binding protein [Reyranella sp.]